MDVWGIFVFVRLFVGYLLLFIFSCLLLSVSDLFSVQVFILAWGCSVFCVGSYSVIPALYRIVSCRSRSVVFRL